MILTRMLVAKVEHLQGSLMPVVKRVENAEMPNLVTLTEKVEFARQNALGQFGSVEKEADGGVEIQVKHAGQEERRKRGRNATWAAEMVWIVKNLSRVSKALI